MVLNTMVSMRYWLLAGLWLAGAGTLFAQTPPAGEVQLTLSQYQQLTQEVQRAVDARDAVDAAESPSIELTGQRMTVVVEDDEAKIEVDLEVRVVGRPTTALALPFGGFLDRVHVERTTESTTEHAPGRIDGSAAEQASVARLDGAWVLVASRAGSYRVHLEGRVRSTGGSAGERFELPRVAAPVAALEVTLPGEVEWRVVDAVTVESRLVDDRRQISLAVPFGGQPILHLQRQVASPGADQLLAQTSVATVIRLRPEGWRRHDAVLYEVMRGDLDRFDLELPSGLEVDDVASDEGPQVLALNEDRLQMPRRQRLSGAGYVVMASPLAPGDLEVDLRAPRPTMEVRSRYLAVAGSVAANIEPMPADSWTRVDLDDLPLSLRQALGAVDLVAAWRLREAAAPGSLKVTPLPTPSRQASVVTERSSMTLLTVDGTLLHRDRLVLSPAGEALDFRLPLGARLWSAQVDGQGVRPVERGDRLTLPLMLGADARVRVEIVSMQERAIEPGRSSLDLVLPTLDLPVLQHSWQLLLPENAKYRFREGTLRPVSAAGADAMVTSRAVRMFEKSSGSSLRGTVRDPDGFEIPGVTVTLTSTDGATRTAITDASGLFRFPKLPPDRYKALAQLEGFSTAYREVRIDGEGTWNLDFALALAELREEIVVTAESPAVLMDQSDFRRPNRKTDNDKRQAERVGATYRQHIAELEQGLVGGVRPLPISIPETGKALSLSGVLPPPEVRARLDMKSKR